MNIKFGCFSVVVAAQLLLFVSPTVSAELSCFGPDSPFTTAGNNGTEVVDWQYCHPISDDVLMYYTPLEEEEGRVQLGLHALETFGWTALALAGNGGMKGASQIVVRKPEGDVWVAEDRHSMDYVTPDMDDSQDVRLLFANQNEDGETAWGVQIPLNSCDEDDYPILNVTKFMHWALGESHETFGFHGKRRGQFQINLLQAPSPVVEPTGEYVDIRMPNVSVELGEGGTDPTNPYICSFFHIPDLMPEAAPGQKLHITYLEPILSEASRPYVHHMILYACDADSDTTKAEDLAHLQVIPECQSMPQGCTVMKWPWAVGVEESRLPDHVGLPLGDEGQTWLVLQMHFYNPNLDTGIVDNSGMRAFYETENLRPQEAGMMQLVGGVSQFQRPTGIPAGQSNYEITPFVIPPTCTEWPEPLHILGVAHHMHMSGKHMEINVERNGTTLGSLRHEKHYDFMHQSAEESPISMLYPGDQLFMHCSYDTSDLTEDISFGDYSQQEMCYAVVVYWPRQPSDTLSYLPVGFNATTCLVPGADEQEDDVAVVTRRFSSVSQCAKDYYQRGTRFFDKNFDFDALTMCNSPLFEQFESSLPGACPPCYLYQNCTAELVLEHGQNVVCAEKCGYEAGVTVWPNVSSTTPWDQYVLGCVGESMAEEGSRWSIRALTVPKPLEAPQCQAKGVFPRTHNDDSEMSDADSSSIVSKINDEGSEMDNIEEQAVSSARAAWSRSNLVAMMSSSFVMAMATTFLQ